MARPTRLEPHDDHGVQGVHQGQASAEPLAAGLGDGVQLVMAPGVLPGGDAAWVGRIRLWLKCQFF